MPKTERLAIKMNRVEKAALEKLAACEGEPVAVVVRQIIRRAVREYESATASTISTDSVEVAHAQPA
jgi:hypothetical protein